MRVLVLLNIGRTAMELGTYCARALRSLGHEVETLPYDSRRFSTRFALLSGLESRLANRRLFRKVASFEPDFLFVVKVDSLSGTTVDALRERFAVPTLNYWIDDPYYLDVSRELSPHYDVFFTNARQCIDAHRQAGAPAPRFLSFGYDPQTHRRVELSEEDRRRYECDVCFSGTITPERLRTLERFADFDLKIWAPPVVTPLGGRYDITQRDVPSSSPVLEMFTGEPVWGAEMVKAFNAARIVLNLHTQDTATMRDFEAPACGAFMLSDYVAELETQYRVGEEIVCFRDDDEAVELAAMYLGDAESRTAIAAAGHRRATESYSYAERMKEVLAVLDEVTA
jgi:spore maturation protein CgeB